MSTYGPFEPLTYAPLNIEVSDLRLETEAVQARLRAEWHLRMTNLIQRTPNFIPRDTCDVQECFAPLMNAYLDEVESQREQGKDIRTYNEFSAEFAAELLPDYISHPHLDVYWFGLREAGDLEPTGAIVITNVQRLNERRTDVIQLVGWPTVVPPLGREVASTWGEVTRFLMNTDLIPVDGEELPVDFVEWVLPTSEGSQYVDRGAGNRLGADIFDAMADRQLVKYEDTVPSRVKRLLTEAGEELEFTEYQRPGGE